MKQKMEAMMQAVQNGNTVDEAIYKVLGIEASPIREKVHAYLEENRTLREKYDGWDTAEAIFHEVAERTNNDCAKQFSWISGIKRQYNLRNLKYSESVLREQGADIEFMRESIERAYQAEQQMAADATEEELAALKQELVDVLPDEDLSFRQVLIQELDSEQAEPLMKALEDAEEMTQEQEDYAVMVAAILRAENEDASENEAVKAAIWHTAEVFNYSIDMLLVTVPELMGESVGAMMIAWLAELVGLSTLSEFFVLVSMATFAASAVVVAIAGAGLTYVALVKCLPYVKKACEKTWEKVKPYVEKVAITVKNAVLRLAGVVVDNVFRPAIYWLNNTAIPVVKETVIYPMKRRLQAMLAWFHAKKEQFIRFVEDAKMHKERHEDNNNDHENCDENVTYGEEAQPERNLVFAT